MECNIGALFVPSFLNVVFIVPCVSGQGIEEEAISLIDRSFKALHSSSVAFNMLLKFKNIRSREAINLHLLRKFDDVLVQFCEEVLVNTRVRTDPCRSGTTDPLPV